MAVYGFEVHITYLKVDAVPSLFDVDHLTHVAHTVASQQLDPSMHGDHWCTTVAKSDGARCQGLRSSWRTNTHWASDPRGDAFSQNHSVNSSGHHGGAYFRAPCGMVLTRYQGRLGCIPRYDTTAERTKQEDATVGGSSMSEQAVTTAHVHVAQASLGASHAVSRTSAVLKVDTNACVATTSSRGRHRMRADDAASYTTTFSTMTDVTPTDVIPIGCVRPPRRASRLAKRLCSRTRLLDRKQVRCASLYGTPVFHSLHDSILSSPLDQHTAPLSFASHRHPSRSSWTMCCMVF